MTNKHSKQSTEKAQDLEVVFWSLYHKVKGAFALLATIADNINRYANIAATAQSLLNITSMLPTYAIGPIGTLFQIFVLATKNNEFLATKFVNIFTSAGSSTTNFISLAVQNIAAPLAIVGASLSFVKYAWAFGELFYRQYKGEHISTAKKAEATHDLIIASIGLVASALLITPVTAPAGFIILTLLGAYRVLDSFGLNPIKKLSIFKEESETVNNASGTTASLGNEFKNEETKKSTQASSPAHKEHTVATATEQTTPTSSKAWTAKSRFHRVGFYAEDHQPSIPTYTVHDYVMTVKRA